VISHSCVNRHESLDASIRYSELNKCKKKRIKKNEYLNGSSLNMSDEEILEIYQSGGLIGLLTHETRVPGLAAIKEFERNRDNADAMRDLYIKLIMSVIFQIVRAINDEGAWDIISFGTDFDGAIDPYNLYSDATTLPDLARDMYQFLSAPFDLTEIGVSAADITGNYLFGLSPQEIVEKIAYKNAMGFLEKYYHDGYLR